MQAELRETIDLKESWNDNRTDCPPFDVGWDKVMLKNIVDQLSAWDRNDINEVNRLNAQMQELAKHGSKI